MPTITYDNNDVACLHLGSDETRFTADGMRELHLCLDSVSPSAVGLVTTGVGKFYSNGLGHDAGVPGSFEQLISALESILSRVLTSPIPTVAAVNGHAFGAGALFALAHDHV